MLKVKVVESKEALRGCPDSNLDNLVMSDRQKYAIQIVYGKILSIHMG